MSRVSNRLRSRDVVADLASTLNSPATRIRSMQELASSEGSSSAIGTWERAGESLANTLSSYLRSCQYLDTFAPRNDVGLAMRIDLSLDALHTRLSHELAQSRTILARMRNETLSRFRSLPNEVISSIFMDVVYASAPGDPRYPSMTRALEIMFGRLFKILSVCSTWRKIGMSLGDLWSFIPLGAYGQSDPTPEMTSWILERSHASSFRKCPLHLVVTPSQVHDLYVPRTNGQVPRFISMIIESCQRGIEDLIEEFLWHRSPIAPSELSIHQICNKPNQSQPCLPSGFVSFDVDHDRFINFIGSLSVLRVKGADIRWEEITFSNKLVELRLQSVVIGYNSQLDDFLQVLQSAPELQHLKIISVVAFPDDFESQGTPEANYAFPKLSSLLLEDLDFNVLRFILGSIVDGSHRLTLFLTPKCQYVYQPDEDREEVDMQDVLEILDSSRVDTLLLSGRRAKTPWLDSTSLRGILKSLPALRSLKMAQWHFESRDLLALVRPLSEGSHLHPSPFPSLSNLSLIDCDLWDPKTLPSVAASHPLRTMELNGWAHQDSATTDPDPSPGLTRFKNDDPVVRQLGAMVPHFRLDVGVWDVEDFNQGVWQLW